MPLYDEEEEGGELSFLLLLLLCVDGDDDAAATAAVVMSPPAAASSVVVVIVLDDASFAVVVVLAGDDDTLFALKFAATILFTASAKGDTTELMAAGTMAGGTRGIAVAGTGKGKLWTLGNAYDMVEVGIGSIGGDGRLDSIAAAADTTEARGVPAEAETAADRSADRASDTL